MAPELIQEQEYDERVDVWSATVIVFILLSEELPFFGADSEEIYDEIEMKELEFDQPWWDCVSAEAKDFLLCGLEKSENKRFFSK